MRSYSTFIIGEGTLPRMCASLLHDANIQILGIISNDADFQRWADERGIPWHSASISNPELVRLLSQRPFDYLFSIINYRVLPLEVLTLPTHNAINYHDAPLPRYAGTYATAWAIMEQQIEHGISWHFMSQLTDAGDILYQTHFLIAPDETTLTLNAKCYMAAVDGFRVITEQIVSDSLQPLPQNLEDRTYYEYAKRPEAASLIEWRKPAAEIESLIRGLYHGTYPNPIATPKIIVNGQLFLPQSARVTQVASSQPAGTIVAQVNGRCVVATSDFDIELSDLLDATGEKVDRPDFEQLGQSAALARCLTEGTLLYQATASEQADLTAYQALVTGHDRYWHKQLLKVIPVVHPYERGALPSQAKAQSDTGLAYLVREDFESLATHGSSTVSWLSLLGTYLHRVTGLSQFNIDLSHSGLSNNPNPAIFASTVPFQFHFDGAIHGASPTFDTVQQVVEKRFNLIAKKQTFTRDIYTRYPDLLALRRRDDFRHTGVALCLYNADAPESIDSQAPLAIYIDESRPNRLEIRFDPQQFDAEYVALIADQLHMLLHSASQQPTIDISHLALLSEAEREKVLYTWNAPSIPIAPSIPVDKRTSCLHQRFADQALLYPDRIAVSYEAEHLTYKTLNEQANHIAHKLHAAGVGPNLLVGLSVDRSLDIVRGILSILKAGGAYVPIDPASPPERTAFIVEDAGMTVLLTQRKQADKLPSNHTARILYIEDLLEDFADSDAENLSAPLTAVSSADTAYVIYTSGSTGKPKGCLVTHRNAVRLMDATDGWYHFSQDDVWTLFHSFAFDFSVWEIWGALFYGGRIVTVPYMVSRSPEAFLKLLVDEGVTVLNQTPSAFRQLVQADIDTAMPIDMFKLRYVIFGGEALELPTLRPWFDRHGDRRPQLVNMYGITETTVHVTYRPINQKDVDENRGSVIGVPIPDLQVYILDGQLQPVPIGIPGEIYVGGEGVATGYLKRPELTAERFIDNPFIPGTRLYKSGDVARLLPNRDIEYIGRSDTQVKIRGFRIELGEIEAAVRNHPQVRDNAVLALTTDSGSKQLVSYFIANDKGNLPSTTELREYVGEQLPPYMVPAFFVPLTTFPLTNNGKLDQAALPKPETAVTERSATYVAPQNDVEEILATIWQAVLRLPHVGTHDNFFELGGDSILSIQIISKAREQGVLLTPHQIFQYTTVAELAAVANIAILEEQEQGPISGEAPLTPIQHWFFEQDFPDKNQWNQSFFVTVAQPLDVAVLEEAIVALLYHHDMLRTCYQLTAAGWTQIIMAEPVKEMFVSEVDLRGEAIDEQANQLRTHASQAQGQLDIQSGKLVQAVYFRLGDSSRLEPIQDRLLLAIHHLVVDGVSWRILFQDLARIYSALAERKEPPLLTKSSSFKVWGDALIDYAQNGFTTETAQGIKPTVQEIDYWRNVLSRSLTPLPIDQNNGENVEGSVDEVLTRFEIDTTATLLRDVPAAYNTQINDLLLTALTLAHYRWTGSTTLLMELEGHGREAATISHRLDLSETVGWFTTVFPLYLDLNSARAGRNVDLGLALMQTKETLRAVPNKGIGYGILRYLDSDSFPVPAAFRPGMVFNYLGQLDQLTADNQLFDLVGESVVDVHSPTAIRRHLLEIIGQVVNGALEIRWLYSQNRHKRETIERFAGYFKEAIHALIDHCIGQERSRYTPSDFPLATLTQKSIDMVWQSAYAQGLAIEDVYQLSPMQQLFYAMDSGNPEVGFEQWHFKINGLLNKSALQEAWRQVIQRHSILRTAFIADGLEQPHQIVYKCVDLLWREVDYSGLSEDEQTRLLAQILHVDKRQPFDLTQPPLNRLILVRMSEQIHHLIWSTHHLEIDGWSWPLVFKDLSTLYGAIVDENPSRLAPAPQYRNYVRWLQSQKPTESAGFWQSMLQGITEPTPLMGMVTFAQSKRTSQAHPSEPIEVTTTLDHISLRKLLELARINHVTLSIVFQAAWGLLLSATSGQRDIVWGATFAGRPTDLPNVGEIVGPFVNNLPIRTQVDDSNSLGAWLSRLQQNQLALTDYQHTPLVQIQQWSEVPIRHRLFNSLVVFQNYTVDESAYSLAGNVNLETLADPQTTNYPITVVGVPRDSLTIKVICRAEYFTRELATDILTDLKDMLNRLAEHPNHLIAEYLNGDQQWRRHKFVSSASVNDGERREPVKLESAPAAATVAPSGLTSAMEEAVASVWRSLFAREHIGLYDNFFELGGHSLMIATMHEELEKKIGRSFPITQAFQYPTIQSLAASLSQGESGRTNDYANVRDRAERSRAVRQDRRSRRN